MLSCHDSTVELHQIWSPWPPTFSRPRNRLHVQSDLKTPSLSTKPPPLPRAPSPQTIKKNVSIKPLPGSGAEDSLHPISPLLRPRKLFDVNYRCHIISPAHIGCNLLAGSRRLAGTHLSPSLYLSLYLLSACRLTMQIHVTLSRTNMRG